MFLFARQVAMGLRREKKVSAQKPPIEVAKLQNIYSHPRVKDLMPLWEGHRQQLERKAPIYLQVGCTGGSFKFTYIMDSDYNGKPMLVYGHVRHEYPPMGILLHSNTPELIVKKEVHHSEDNKVVAVEWQYCMSGNYLTSKFYWKDVSRLCL